MNYFKHYERLCNRAKNRQLSGYKERHHITPRCMGGSDEEANIVELTAEEHYVVHQLLIKMHPKHKGLIFAAIRMTGDSNGDNRRGNKSYGWLRRKSAKNTSALGKERLGNKNGSFGTHWIYNLELEENKKISKSDIIPEGWKLGRVMDFKKRKENIEKEKEWKKEKIQKRKIFERKRHREVVREIKPLYERYILGESITSVAKDYKYSFQSLHLKFKKYFPRVKRNTGRGNKVHKCDD